MKNKWRILKILVTVIIFGLLLRFSLNKFNDAPIKKISVKMISSEEPVYFLDEGDVKSMVKKHTPSLKIGDLNIPKIERKLNELDAIDSANVFLNLNGVLSIDMLQKVPKFRLKKTNKNFYVDEFGNEFSTSRKYSHPCMLVSGNVKPEEYPQIIEWIGAIENDDFAREYFIGISKHRKDYYLLTNDGDFKVEIGDLMNADFKLKGFKTFVKKHLVFQDKKKYNKVSLKYSNQIVATLRK